MRDFPIRVDLAKIGLPERTIRVLEKVTLLIQALEDINSNQSGINDLNDATDALNEAIEDANLSLTSLDARVDTLEAFQAAGPYVNEAGDTMSGPLNVNALLECDSLKINTAPTVAAAVASTHKVAVDLNGTTYYLLASNV